MSDPHCTGINLPGKYEPHSLGGIRGQPRVVASLQAFIRQAQQGRSSAAFVFIGPTGVGKTAAARALAYDLGCCREDPELSGLHEIPSGKQDGKAVESLLDSLRLRPLLGSGWRVAIINEADCMTPQAEAIWLDGLEHLPPRTVVIFTTNRIGRLTDRLTSRCEVLSFDGESEQFQAAMFDLVRDVWKNETGKALHRVPEDLGRFDLASGTFSIRLALQQIAPFIRSNDRLPASFRVPFMREEANGASTSGSSAARKAWQTRRAREVNHA